MTSTALPATRWHVTLVDRVRFHGRRPKNRRQLRKRWKDRRNWRPDMRPWETRLLLGALNARTMQPWKPEELPRGRFLSMHTLLWERMKTEAPAFADRCDVFVRVPMGTPSFRWYDEKQVWPQKDAGTYVKVFDFPLEVAA